MVSRRTYPVLVLAALAVSGAPPALAAPVPAQVAAQAWVEPKDLGDAVRRLALARLAIAATGEVRLRYSEQALHAQAASGHVPNTRYLVRLVHRPALPEGPLAIANGSGAAALWVATFDQLEPADTDPEAVARLVGIPYNAQESYTLLLLTDLGADAAQRPPLVCPTYAGLTALAVRELVGPGYSAEDLRAAMAPGYQPTYATLMKAYYAAGFSPWVPGDLKTFVARDPRLLDPYARRLFLARLRVHNQFGASELFRGDGVTELIDGGARKAGVVELFVLDHAPKAIGAYEADGRLLRVPCSPLAKPTPLRFVGP